MTLLLIVIYTAFIGLGVPDSLIGAAWPAIYPEMKLPVESVSFITLIISGCTVISSMFSMGILNKLGTAKVTAISMAMTALALIGFSLAPHFFWMVPLAAVLGLGAGAIDSGLNNYIALHYKVSHMNFLHGFYGIGVSVSPYFMSLAIDKTSWRTGYIYAFIIQTVITMVLVFSFPLWKKAGKDNIQEEKTEAKNMSVWAMAKISAIRAVWVIMLATNAIEYSCGTWGSTYLVNEYGFSAKEGAAAITLYYMGLAAGRLLSGLLSAKVKTWSRIGIGTAIVSAAMVIMLLPLPAEASVTGLALIGLGNGSIYPNFVHLTPHHFGREISQAVMGSQIAFAYIGVMIAPPLISLSTSVFGIESYPFMLMGMFVIMAVSTLVFVKQLKKQKRFNKEI